jgi:hypothetical protein
MIALHSILIVDQINKKDEQILKVDISIYQMQLDPSI